MEDIVTIVKLVGSIASALLAVIAFLGVAATQTKKGKNKIKNWLKSGLGFHELSKKIDEIQVELKKRSDCEVEIKEDIKSQMHALQCILRKEIREMCEYCIENESVSVKDREIIQAAFHAYQSLNGNSFVCGLVQRTLDLPIDNNN